MREQQDYRLGRNVTERAQAQESRGTVVVSFRVSNNEFDALSDLAESQGRTVSQVAREAFRQGLTSDGPTRRAAISFLNGNLVSFGTAYGGTFGTGEPEVEKISYKSDGFLIEVTG